MPPCRKICTGRLLPTPLPVAPVGGGCCPVPAHAAPAPAPAPAQLACTCDEEPELACDEDTCANSAYCKQQHPEFCPHGFGAEEISCSACQPQQPARPELTLLCPHCRSQISMSEDPKQQLKNQSQMTRTQSQPRNTWPVKKQPNLAQDSATGSNEGHCDPICPSMKPNEIQHKSSNSPSVSCCGSSNLKLSSPHISQIKVSKGDDLECRPLSPAPLPPDAAMSCCMSASAIRSASHMGRTSDSKSITCEGTGPKTCSVMNDPTQIKKGSVMDPPMAKMGPQTQGLCKTCMQAMAGPPTSQSRGAGQPNQKSIQTATRPTRGSSGIEPPSPGDPSPSCGNCPRSGAGAGALFPAPPPAPACLCRMPPAYTIGCTGNLAGNCNCASCNK